MCVYKQSSVQVCASKAMPSPSPVGPLLRQGQEGGRGRSKFSQTPWVSRSWV